MTVMTVVLVLLLTVLVSCGGGQKAPTLTVQKTPDSNFGVEKDPVTGEVIPEEAKNKLSSGDLKNIADMLASVYSANYNTQMMLIAAANGYFAAPVLVDGGVNASDAGVMIENATDVKTRLRLVQNLILDANEKATDKKLPTDTLAKISNENKHGDADKNISAADVRSLIDCFKITVTPTKAGIIDTILLWIGKAVAWITDTICFGSYLAGICIFAIIIEILMLPFAIKQQKNSIRQAKLRPKEMAIRNKYAGRKDQATMQKMQQEIQEFYQKEHYSPYSGCISLLIQMPIIIALYNIIINPLHYMLAQSNEIVTALTAYAAAPTTAGGAGMSITAGSSTISLLSEIGKAPEAFVNGLKNFELFNIDAGTLDGLSNSLGNLPNFTVLGIDFGMAPAIGTFNILLLVPILTFAAYFITSKLNRKFMYQPVANAGAEAQQVACSNSMMDITMPLMSTFFTFMVPALVGVYWIFRSFVGLLKQFIISKVMPLPVFTEEDYKAAEREMKSKQSSHVNKSNSGKTRAVRSLHYIDDEDFEDTRERALARKAAIEEREREEQAEKAKKTPFGAAPMKEDNKKKDQKADESVSAENSEDDQNNTQE